MNEIMDPQTQIADFKKNISTCIDITFILFRLQFLP